jgi:excisionase family DNA binding protein
MTTNRPLTLTVEQTAQLLGVSRSTAYELVNTGQLEHLRLRRRIVIPTSRVAERLGVSLLDVWNALPSDRPF